MRVLEALAKFKPVLSETLHTLVFQNEITFSISKFLSGNIFKAV